jgi:Zn-dependent M28 family amino/carboxypeptidase
MVVVGAHYDTVPGSPGANDNASGVAALLCLAERFAAASPARTLRFVAFANEEAPFAHTAGMGSRVYARRCREKGERIAAMLCLETIGFYADAPRTQTYPRPLGWFYPSRGDFIAFVGSTRWGRLVADAAGAFRRAEPFPVQAGALPESVSDIARSDHASFWREGYPAVMVTDTANFRYPHYHTPEDTVEKIGFDRLARVVRGLEAVVSALGRAGQRAGPCRRGRPFGNL